MGKKKELCQISLNLQSELKPHVACMSYKSSRCRNLFQDPYQINLHLHLHLLLRLAAFSNSCSSLKIAIMHATHRAGEILADSSMSLRRITYRPCLFVA